MLYIPLPSMCAFRLICQRGVYVCTVSSQLFLTPVGRQVSQRLAEQARKRELFEEMKQQLEHQQEVRQVIMFVSVAHDSLT